MRILVALAASAQLYALAAVPAGYEEMASYLRPQFYGVPDSVNRSSRIESIDFIGDRMDVIAVIGAIDTTKNKADYIQITDKQFEYAKMNIVNPYCAPLGGGNLFFNALRQQKIEINYYIDASTRVPLYSFRVSPDSCD